MMRKLWMSVMVILGLAIAGQGLAAMFTWTDPDGSYHATDRVDKLPPQYQAIIRHDLDHYVTPGGIGFERDEKGNFRFFDHSSPAKIKTTRTPPAELSGPPGSPVTAAQLDEIKRRYQQWGQERRPEVMDARVRRIISGDTFELDTGQKVTYIGIEFPEELKGETRIHQEVVAYQKKLMQGRTVHLLFGSRRFDDKGRLLALVFIGTDMFVNADLVMNGYARVHTVPPNTEYQNLFLRLQDFAKRSMLGMWDTGTDEPEAAASK